MRDEDYKNLVLRLNQVALKAGFTKIVSGENGKKKLTSALDDELSSEGKEAYAKRLRSFSNDDLFLMTQISNSSAPDLTDLMTRFPPPHKYRKSFKEALETVLSERQRTLMEALEKLPQPDQGNSLDYQKMEPKNQKDIRDFLLMRTFDSQNNQYYQTPEHVARGKLLKDTIKNLPESILAYLSEEKKVEREKKYKQLMQSHTTMLLGAAPAATAAGGSAAAAAAAAAASSSSSSTVAAVDDRFFEMHQNEEQKNQMINGVLDYLNEKKLWKDGNKAAHFTLKSKSIESAEQKAEFTFTAERNNNNLGEITLTRKDNQEAEDKKIITWTCTTTDPSITDKQRFQFIAENSLILRLMGMNDIEAKKIGIVELDQAIRGDQNVMINSEFKFTPSGGRDTSQQKLSQTEVDLIKAHLDAGYKEVTYRGITFTGAKEPVLASVVTAVKHFDPPAEANANGNKPPSTV